MPITLKKADTRHNLVKLLQEALIRAGHGSLLGSWGADGLYGNATFLAVKALQADRGRPVTGVADPATIAALGLDAESLAQVKPASDVQPVADGQGVLDKRDRCTRDILASVSSQSALLNDKWSTKPPGRGKPPVGFVRGMALTYARVYCNLKRGDRFAVEMAKAVKPGDDRDALALYDNDFKLLNMDNSLPGKDTLRHVFVFLMGLGMHESSGCHCDGMNSKDPGSNTANTAEAGLFQISHSLGVESKSPSLRVIKDLYAHLNTLPESTSLLDVFRDGVSCTKKQWTNIGATNSGGWKFQEFCKQRPSLSAELAAVGIRMRRAHWGTIGDRDVVLNAAADVMFKQVEGIVDAGGCCSSILVSPQEA